MSRRHAGSEASEADRRPIARKFQARGVRGHPPFDMVRPALNSRAEIWRRRSMLAGHLRDGTWLQRLQKAARARRIVLGIGRKHDQEEAVFRRQRKTRHIEYGM